MDKNYFIGTWGAEMINDTPTDPQKNGTTMVFTAEGKGSIAGGQLEIADWQWDGQAFSYQVDGAAVRMQFEVIAAEEQRLSLQNAQGKKTILIRK
jgi:hypothetical protein